MVKVRDDSDRHLICHEDDLYQRYASLGTLGEGTFSKVVCCKHGNWKQ